MNEAEINKMAERALMESGVRSCGIRWVDIREEVSPRTPGSGDDFNHYYKDILGLLLELVNEQETI